MNFRGKPQTKGRVLVAALESERRAQSTGVIPVFLFGFVTGACTILWLLLC